MDGIRETPIQGTCLGMISFHIPALSMGAKCVWKMGCDGIGACSLNRANLWARGLSMPAFQGGPGVCAEHD